MKTRRYIAYINEQIESNINDNFWIWFKGSKIQNNGKPIVLYHGTKVNFDVFKPSRSVGNQGESDQIEGIYLTDNKEAASFFSIAEDERYLKRVYASLKNPYYSEGHNELKKELGIERLGEANKKLKELGYDGLILNRGFYAKGGPFVLYLAFYPNQVKSVKNDGTWGDDNNIYK